MLELILELLGTVAFSLSGAVVGIKKKMGIMGVTTLGVITAVGGGIVRDVLIGVTPPNTFLHPVYIAVALFSALLMYIPSVYKKLDLNNFFWFLADSLGLGAFTVIGAYAGLPYGHFFLEVFLGVSTGIGGGIIRDICANRIPVVFTTHTYGFSCLTGAVIYAVTAKALDPDIAAVIGFAVVVLLRLFSEKNRWKLPRVK